MTDTFNILSIDGGGIRGIIPAMVLAEIERRTGRPVAQLFDLLAGTSTGGILALGLAMPGPDGAPAYRADDLVRLYDEEGRVIFGRSPWRRLGTLGGALEEKYPRAPIEAVLAARFGESRLSEVLVDVLVTAYDIEQRRPFFFKSHNVRQKGDYDHLLRDAARATSAAPTYFEPARVPAGGALGYRALVDGGVFANNPAMCALVEALCKFGVSPKEVCMVSLGTGELTRPIRFEEARGWGLLEWAQPILNVVFDGVSDTVNYQTDALLGATDEGVRRLYRFQRRLDEGSDDLDDATRTNLRVLKLLAADLIDDESRVLDGLCAHLARHQARVAR